MFQCRGTCQALFYYAGKNAACAGLAEEEVTCFLEIRCEAYTESRVIDAIAREFAEPVECLVSAGWPRSRTRSRTVNTVTEHGARGRNTARR